MTKLIAVVVGCFLLGYWLVSVFLPNLKRESPPQSPPRADPVQRPWFEILEVPSNAPLADIQEAYQRLRGKYTAEDIDRLPIGLRASFDEKLQELDRAYRDALYHRE
ncbi:MAG: hypothetical protein JSR63_01920 [Proteobacteria bacterium]|nr:hypothetical protein [Pseudomonadota bacterium]